MKPLGDFTYNPKNLTDTQSRASSTTCAMFMWEGLVTTLTTEQATQAGGWVTIAAALQQNSGDLNAQFRAYQELPPSGQPALPPIKADTVLVEWAVELGRGYARQIQATGRIPDRLWWLKHLRDTLAIFLE